MNCYEEIGQAGDGGGAARPPCSVCYYEWWWSTKDFGLGCGSGVGGGGFDRVGGGRWDREGQKKKARTNRREKRREKRYVENSGFGNQEANPIQPSGSFHQRFSVSRHREKRLRFTDFWLKIQIYRIPSLPRSPISSILCARIKMWPRLEITTENYRQDLLQRCDTGIINRASLYNQPDGFKNQPLASSALPPCFFLWNRSLGAQTLSDKRR